MSRRLVAVFACCLTLGIAFPVMSSDPAQPPEEPTSGWERYKILVQRNIFAKDRGRNSASAQTPKASDSAKTETKDVAASAKPESETVLIGISLKDDKPTAFLENRKTNVLQTVHENDAVLRGKITKITLECIEYTCDTTVVTINVGQAMDGTVAAPTVASSSGSPSTTGSQSNTGSASDNAVLERLRKKRQEELQK